MNLQTKTILLTGCLLGATGVVIGAFGAHALEELLAKAGRTDTFETAVSYQMYHALALLAIGLISDKINHTLLRYGAYAMMAGVVIFSCSLYVLCLIDRPALGMITPFGGLFLIVGWVLAFLGIKKGYPNN